MGYTCCWKLKPSAEFSFTDDDYSTVKWDVLEGNAPTQEIDVAIEQIKAEDCQAEAKSSQRQAILSVRFNCRGSSNYY
jgi:hypothetical protein